MEEIQNHLTRIEREQKEREQAPLGTEAWDEGDGFHEDFEILLHVHGASC